MSKLTPSRVYAVGVVLAALAGFLSYWPFLGFIPLGAGSIWAAYDLIDTGGDDAESETTTASR